MLGGGVGSVHTLEGGEAGFFPLYTQQVFCFGLAPALHRLLNSALLVSVGKDPLHGLSHPFPCVVGMGETNSE